MTTVAPLTTCKTDCPSCHAPAAFCPRSIFGQFWMTRCTKCRYYTSEPLPKITKKVIYLDQLVLSNMLFSKDPRWAELLQRLRLLNYLQIIVCPSSKVHVDESLLAESSRDVLKALYRELSGGSEFLTPQDIEQNQLLDGIRQYMRSNTASVQWQKPKPWQEYSKNDPHHWSGDYTVYADFPLDPARVDRLKTDKADLHNDLKAVAAHWMGETNSFIADVKRGALSYGNTLLAAYRELADGRKKIEAMLPSEIPEMVEAYKIFCGSDKFDPRTPPGVQPGVQLVHWLAAEVHRVQPDESDPVAVVEKFFQSNVAMEVPFQYIASRLWATLTRSGVDPQRSRKAKPSDNYDVTAISHYAPYCDAMVVDNEFCAMVTQKNIDVPGKFGTQLFCAKTLDKFLDYLAGLATNIPNDHRIALKQMFPRFAGLPLLKTDDESDAPEPGPPSLPAR